MESETLLEPQGSAARADKSVAEACRAAKELENIGKYEAAGDAISAFWPGIGKQPRTEGLATPDQAELLLRAGALSGWIGDSRQAAGTQQFAQELIAKSIRLFEQLKLSEKVAEAQTDLAICLWRDGALADARASLQAALAQAKEPINILRILVNSSTVEVSSNDLHQALAFLDRAATLLESIQDDAALGRYFLQRGIVMRRLGGDENLERALLDHDAARAHFQKAGHRRYFARAQNNIGVIMLERGRFDEALDALEDASRTFAELGDAGSAAQVNDARARVYVAQQRYPEAESAALESVAASERQGELLLLAETLQTLGVAQARQHQYHRATETLRRAAETAEAAGDSDCVARAQLTMLEELNESLAPDEISRLYAEADTRLGEDVNRETMNRLRACARLLASGSGPTRPQTSDLHINFEEEVRRCESSLIRQALEEANGSVTRAARILGLTHQGLCYIINHRHKSLLSVRAPIRVRRKSIMKKHK